MQNRFDINCVITQMISSVYLQTNKPNLTKTIVFIISLKTHTNMKSNMDDLPLFWMIEAIRNEQM